MLHLIYKTQFVLASGLGRLLLYLVKGLKLGVNVNVRGIAHVDIRGRSRIIIGNNTVLNSSNYGYHMNMFSAVKLLADGEDALIRIGSNCRIHGTCIHARERIEIGNNVLIAANTNIIDSNGHDMCWNDPSKRINTNGAALPVIIADDVWIGANVIILPGVTIGRGAIIGAGCVVNRPVPSMSLAFGNPMNIKLINVNNNEGKIADCFL
ncbi:Acetyltransferase (isoleucine patch superfamily) [Chitinophaga sp. CF118]|uniref:acyltransferase n=1 Tax=Chitinophaga sp. CF118 TaxID=1884367 RepID=UPI0008ED8626|nr:acyltransferase [Chitinophaga sp. CF118]SFD80693.1 Acetyltransferase (isoleucine patch superfamily) [Chitinophaga sp. CF118]